MTSASQLTRTELETLAVFIGSAGQHMCNARDSQGNYVWADTADYHTAYNEMLEGFYALQADPWAELVTVDA